MARSITVRNVPDEVVDELAARAARRGQSLQEYLKAYFIEETSRMDVETWLEQVRSRKAAGLSAEIGVDAILEARDADRR